MAKWGKRPACPTPMIGPGKKAFWLIDVQFAITKKIHLTHKPDAKKQKSGKWQFGQMQGLRSAQSGIPLS